MWRSGYGQTGSNHININVEGSDVTIKVGDIFQQPGLKVIAFNEYFDTQVDNRIIAESSLNGTFIKCHLNGAVENLDSHIESYAFDQSEKLRVDNDRRRKKAEVSNERFASIRTIF